MSDGLDRATRKTGLWIGVVAGLAAGIGAAIMSGGGSWIKSAVTGLTIVCGLFLLTPFATVRPTDESQRKNGRRVLALGASFVLWGIAELVPNVTASLTLMGVTLVLLAGSAAGWPPRVFGPRS